MVAKPCIIVSHTIYRSPKIERSIDTHSTRLSVDEHMALSVERVLGNTLECFIFIFIFILIFIFIFILIFIFLFLLIIFISLYLNAAIQ